MAELPRVSSDCKPVPAGGRLCQCAACGALQRPITPQFLKEIADIYAGYDVYYQSGGLEQLVWDAAASTTLRRSELLCRRLAETGLLPRSGRVLDVGCGNGAFLAAMAEEVEGWALFGLELDRRSEERLRGIPGFRELIVADVLETPGTYELVTMIHALEHMTEPLKTLEALRRNLAPGGLLFIECPNAAANPFDLVIADHASHFTPVSLARILARAGFEVLRLETSWVSKELSAVATPSAAAVSREFRDTLDAASQIAWLNRTLAKAKALPAQKFGLFGTSIAAVWLTAALSEYILFYVDEDQSRQGVDFFGKPVVAPGAVPVGAPVFVGLAPAVADVVTARLKGIGIDAVGPADAAPAG